MFQSRLLLLFGFFCLGNHSFSQATYSAKQNGNWNDINTWSIVGVDDDADGIPDADDDVIIQGYEVRMNSTETAKSLLIESTGSNLNFIVTGALGSLTISNDLTITSSSAFARVRIQRGSLTVLGSIIYNNPVSVSNGGLLVINSGSSLGLDKQLQVNGNIPSGLFNKFAINIDGTGTSAFDLHLSGIGTQSIPGNRFSYLKYSKIFIDNGSTLVFDANNDAPFIYDSIKVDNGSILLDEISLEKVDEFENQITVASGSKITVHDDIPFPDHQDKNAIGFVTDMQAGSTSEYDVSASFDVNIIGEDFNYRDVVLKGEGIKTITNNINGAGAFVNNLTIEEGTVIIDAAVTDISGITGTITVQSGATLQIKGNPSMPAAGQFDLQEGSIVDYASNAGQTILGGLNYSNIRLSGTGAKTTGAAFSIDRRMYFSTDVSTLNINHDITLESDASGTAFISAVPTGYNLVYGGGQFICERFFITTPRDNNNASENYRDFSLPLIASDATLSQFDDDNPFPYTYSGGKFTNLVELPIFGVPDSKYPGVASTNVSDFNSTSGAFGTPGSYNNSIVQTNGGGKITTNAVRFGWGDDEGLTILAKGEINYGDQVFNVQKSLFGKEFNLLGNPYPCAIDFRKITEDNPNFADAGQTGIKATYYVIGPDEFGANNTGFYNAITNTGTASRFIPAFQGFFIEVVSGGASSFDFTISESHKRSEDFDTYKTGNEDYSPELTSIKVMENGFLKDQIHFYFFEGGTNSFEEVLDVKKLEPKVTALTGAKLDFYDGKKKLNLLANALNDQKDMDLQFVVENPDGHPIELELSNLSHLLDIYNCVYLENLRTQEIYTVDGDFLTINLGSITQETFIIKTVSAPDLFEINSSDATCHGFEDGLIRVDMSNLPENSPVTVLKNNTPFETFNSTASVYKKSVGAGLYEFRITGITELCTYVYRETIEDEEEVIAEFTISDSLEAGKEVIFTSTSKGSTVNEWLNSLGETTYGNTLSMTYENAGRYWVKLTAIGNYETCNDEELKFFEILPAESGVGIEDSPFEAISIATLNKTIEVRGLPNGSTIELLSSEGKLIKTIDEKNGIAIFANLKGADYLIRISNNNKSVTHHIGLQ